MTESRWTQLLLGINALFLGYLIFFRGEATPESLELSTAVSLFDDQLKQGDYQASYDLLMTSFRLAPTDSRLVGMVERFVAASTKSGELDALDLADDVLARSASLVHFQKPSDVAAVRKRLDALRPSAGALDDAGSALALATDKDLPIEDRFESLEQAKATLTTGPSTETVPGESSDDTSQDVTAQATSKQIIEAEQSLQLEAISPIQKSIDELQQKYKDIAATLNPADGTKSEPLTAETFEKLDEKLSNLEQSAVPLVLRLDEISDLFAQVPTGSESPAEKEYRTARASLDELVAKIRSRRIYHYNQFVLQRLEEIKSKDDDAVDALVALLSHEGWLMEFVAERFNEKWALTMDRLGQSEKLDAMTKRVFLSLKTQR